MLITSNFLLSGGMKRIGEESLILIFDSFNDVTLQSGKVLKITSVKIQTLNNVIEAPDYKFQSKFSSKSNQTR